MDSTQLITILGQLHTCTDEDSLQKIFNLTRIKLKEARIRNANKIGWHEGQIVRMKPNFHQRKPYDSKGTVHKVNRVKVVVDFGTMGRYNIPKNMLVDATK